MSTLKVTHLQNESNSAPSISISSAVGGGVTFAGISTFHNHIQIGASIGRFDSSGLIKTAHGTEASPSHTFINDPDNGMFRPTTNTIGFSCAGSERLRITSAGSLQVKGDTNPNAVFDRGSANTTNVNFNYNGTLTGQLGAANAEFQISASGASTPLVAYVNGAERLRITSGGDLGLGVSANMSQAGTLHLIGGQGVRWQHPTGGALYGDHYVSATGKHVFRTGSSLTTQAEIDSTGIKLPSGKGINFSAYATSGNPSSNLLDDYEEGTWTAALSSSGGGLVYAVTNAVGYYTKIGDVVHAWYYTAALNISNNGTGSARISGLPFNSANLPQNYGVVATTHNTAFTPATDSGYVATNNDQIVFQPTGATSSSNWTQATSRYLMIHATYKAA